jgi:hypothetical protein
MAAAWRRLQNLGAGKRVRREKEIELKRIGTTMNDARNEKSQEQRDFDEYQQEEAKRIAREEGPGEATPPDLEGTAVRAQGSPTSDENWDSTRQPREDKSLEDRDTNDGDANTENN